MADNSLKISYKIYLEAEDISQSRISSTASYVRNLFKNCTNSYLQKAEVDNESDMDDFTLRLYIDEKVEVGLLYTADPIAAHAAHEQQPGLSYNDLHII